MSMVEILEILVSVGGTITRQQLLAKWRELHPDTRSPLDHGYGGYIKRLRANGLIEVYYTTKPRQAVYHITNMEVAKAEIAGRNIIR